MGGAIDSILYQVHRDVVFEEDYWLSDFSNVEVWEAGRKASSRQNMNDARFQAYLKDETRILPEEPLFRAIFIPDTIEDTDRLQLTKPAFELLLEKHRVVSRLPGLMRQQMQPSRQIEYDPETHKPTHIQYLYSAIVRSLDQAANPHDPTKRILDWRRLCVWTRRDMRSGVTTMILLRCPAAAREAMVRRLGDGGAGQRELLRHPMLVHALLAEDLVRRSTDFSKDFAAPLYPLELRLGSTTAEFTERARRFMTMARQMGNVMIDYDIYLASLELLQEVYQWTKEQDPPVGLTAAAWRAAHLDFDGRNFKTAHQEFALLRRYGALYEERTKIGNAESTALVNQRDAEMTKQMSAESTVIARSAHRDGQSLRIIQYLGLFFLPLSLCTSIFGMGFFGTSPDQDTKEAIFVVGDAWWWFLALALPLTGVVLASTWVIVWWSTRRVERKRSSEIEDLEKLFSYSMDQ